MGDRLRLPEIGFALSMFSALLGGPLSCDARDARDVAARPSTSIASDPSPEGAVSGARGIAPRASPQNASGDSRPNIALIIIDTLRADMLGAYGFALPTSPELDALARDGVRFARVVTPNTWTRPAHGALLTSLHPRTLGLYKEQREILADRFVTLAEALQARGYFTVGATANPNINSFYNFHQGFEVYVDTSVVLGWMDPAPGERVLGVDGYRLPVVDEVFESILDELRDRGDAPYYAQANLMEVHEAGSGCEADAGQAMVLDAEYRALFPDVRPCLRREYLQSIRALSRAVDRFVRTLSSLPGGRETLFAITSDHGETLPGDHPSLGRPKWHGWLVYESQALVPWILYSPGRSLPRGVVIDRPVSLLDLMPTVLDFAGIDGPGEMVGRSLMPLIRHTDESVELPEHFVVETQLRRADKIAVYSAEWKYVENRDDHRGTRPRELHPMGALEDGATTDVAEHNPDVAAELAKQLRDWESTHPRAAATLGERAAPESLVKQLRAIGYAQ